MPTLLQSTYSGDILDGHSHFTLTQSFDPHSATLVVRKRVGRNSDPVEALVQLRREFSVLGHLQGIEGVQHPVRLDTDPAELVLRAVGGTRLSDLDWDGKLTWTELIDFGVVTLNVLSAIHSRQVVHLGINPSQLTILSSGAEQQRRVVLSGFSGSMMRGLDPGYVDDHMAIMQLAYVAPEQTGLTGSRIDRRADLYSLGVVLYQLACGRLPFDATNPEALIRAHVTTAPPPPHHVKASVPVVLSQVISRLLRKEPQRRYESAEELAAELTSIRPLLNELAVEGLPASLAASSLVGKRSTTDVELIEVASAALSSFDVARNLNTAEEAVASALRNANRHGDAVARSALDGFGRFITLARDPGSARAPPPFDLREPQPVPDPTQPPLGPDAVGALEMFYRCLAAVLHDDERVLSASYADIQQARAVLRTPYIAAASQFVSCMILHAQARLAIQAADASRSMELQQLLERDALRFAEQAIAQPESFGHLHSLVEAMRARLEGRRWDAGRHFDAAIEGARRNGRHWQLAFVMEHAARFCMAEHVEYSGKNLLGLSYDLYRHWGFSESRCRVLEQDFPSLATLRMNPARDRRTRPAVVLDEEPHDKPVADDVNRSEPELAVLVSHMLEAIEHMTGATSLAMMFNDGRNGWLIAGARCDGERIPGLPVPIAAAAAMGIPDSILQYALQSQRPETIANAAVDPRFTVDPQLERSRCSALLILPILSLGKPHALLLLENDTIPNSFAGQDLGTLELITGTLASSIENALAFRALERRVARRTGELERTSSKLLLREQALARSTNGVMICEVGSPDMPIVYVNDMFETITGYSSGEVLGKDARFLQRGDTMQAGAFLMSRAIDDRRGCSGVVVRNYRKDNTLFYNEVSIAPFSDKTGVVTHFVGTLVDVTGRLQSEIVERRKTERLGAVFELSPDGFVVVDEAGYVNLVNPAFERMTGLQAKSLVGKRLETFEALLSTLAAPETMSSGASPDFEVTGVGEPARPVPQRASDKRGLIRLIAPQPRILLRRERRGESPGRETVIYFRDVTQEMEIDQMKSDFLSTAAHELRTPMTSIFGFTELVLKRKMNDEQRQGMLETIHRQSETLIHLINELLDLARIEARRGTDFHYLLQPLAPIVERTAAAIIVAGDERRVSVQPTTTPYWVNVDADKLGLVITNLLSNAFKYSSKGEIAIRYVTREVAQRNRCEVGVQVIDQGIGMSPPQLARLYERFFRVDTSGRIQGTGLGTTIAKEIVDIHDGELVAESALGQGTTLTIWLPLHDDPAKRPAADAAAP